GFALCLFPARAADSPAARSLKIGVVQMEERPGLAENQDKIIAFIRRAASLRCRVVVLPEGALGGTPNQAADLEPAKAAIRAAAAQARIYVVFGGSSRDAGEQKPHNWMEVADPAGQSIFHYDKIYDRHTAKMPGIFRIDGIPCNGMICADRWLRGIEEVPIMEGAQISFELSGNYAVEWVPALQWYWYVPRAVRNNVYVIFSNTSGPASHGHSAVVAPDGSLLAAG